MEGTQITCIGHKNVSLTYSIQSKPMGYDSGSRITPSILRDAFTTGRVYDKPLSTLPLALGAGLDSLSIGG